MAKEIEELWKAEEYFSGAAVAVNKQIGYLHRFGIFTLLNNEAQRMMSQPPWFNIPLRKVLVVSDPLRIEEEGYIKDRFNSRFNPQGVSFLKRRRTLPISIYLSLVYNGGVPATNLYGELTTDTQDDITIASHPNGIVVSHMKNIDGIRRFSEEHKFSVETIGDNPHVIAEALGNVLEKNPYI